MVPCFFTCGSAALSGDKARKGREGSNNRCVCVIVLLCSLAGVTPLHVYKDILDITSKREESGRQVWRKADLSLNVRVPGQASLWASNPFLLLSGTHYGKSHVGSELLDLQCPPQGCASITVNLRLKGSIWGNT